VLAIAPATSRNWVRGHQFVLVSSNAAINLFIGNNSSYDAMTALRPGRDWRALQRVREQYGEGRSASAFFVRRVLTYVRTDPVGFSLLQAKKLRLLLGGDEIFRNQAIYPVRTDSPVLRVLLWKLPWLVFPFGLLAPLAILGLVVGARRAPMLAFVALALATTVVVFFVTARYRAPLVPLLLVFAAEGMRWIVTTATGRARLAALGLVVPVFLLANLGQGPMPVRMNADAEFGLATLLESEGRRAEALALYERVARENPTYYDAWERLSRALRAEGRTREADEALRVAEAIVPEFFDTLIMLGGVYAKDGRWGEAAEYYRRALDLQPGDPVAQAGLTRAREEARTEYEKAIAVLPDAHAKGARYAWLGLWLQKVGDMEGAETNYLAALRYSQNEETALNNLAVIYARRGNDLGALDLFLRLLRVAPHHVTACRNASILSMRLGISPNELRECQRKSARANDSSP